MYGEGSTSTRRDIYETLLKAQSEIGEGFVVVEDEKITYANEAYCRMTGYEVHELKNLPSAFVLIAPEEKAELRERSRRRLSSHREVEHYDTAIIRKDGRRVDVEVVVKTLRIDDRTQLVFAVRDITERKRAQQQLQDILDNTTAAVYAKDLQGRYILVNNRSAQLMEMGRERMLGKTDHELLSKEEADALRANDQRVLATGDPLEFEEVFRLNGGTRVYLTSKFLLRDQDGAPYALCGVSTDITERRQAEAALRESEARYRAVVEDQTELICRFSPDGTLTFVNQAYCRYFDKSPEQLVGRSFVTLVPAEDRAAVERHLAQIRQLTPENPAMESEHRVVLPDGETRWHQWIDRVIFDGRGELVECQSVGRDVTDRKRAEEQLEYQAFHDQLTGLPNRFRFGVILEHALARAERQGSKVAVLLLDLDDFKVVNDSLGHHAGDELLKLIAARLKNCLRPQDVVGRFGGDEFVLLIEDARGEEEITAVAKRIVESVRGHFTVRRRRLFVNASIGVAIGASRRDLPEDLLRKADTAMYRAKELDTNFCVFDPGMHAKVMERLRRESELRRALEREEFILHYQPQVRLETGRIVGVEVLARWRHPGRGLVGAYEFIWDAEDSGLIIPLGRWVLEEACRQAAAWQERYPGDPPLAVAVNISARQLHRMDLPQDVSRILRETGLKPCGLVLEVTEGSTIEDLQMGNDTLGDLKALGVQVTIDDFGTGYSSLSYLRHLPADVLKIDKSFVHALGESAEDTAILRTIVELAHTLGMEVKAEGVETPEQAALVRELGCDMAQGNHFFAPLPSTEVAKLFAAG